MIRHLRNHWARYLVLAVAAGVAVIHRNATADPWADDRALSLEPAWFQMSAPLWHAAATGSPSLPGLLTRLVDPLTAASMVGDTRGLAAIAAALGAAGLFAVLRHAAVPVIIAALLCLTQAARVLPVAASLSLAHAAQPALAMSMLLVVWHRGFSNWLRLSLLAVLTIVGALIHPAFLALAAGVWGVTVLDATARRARTSVAAIVTLGAAAAGAGWMLHAAGNVAVEPAGGRPGVIALTMAIVSGRFAGEWQPMQHSSLHETIVAGLPGPMLLGVVLVAVGLAAPRARRTAVTSVAAAGGAILFTAYTWLPDPAVALAPARGILVVPIGIGLAWLWDLRTTGARALVVVAGLLISGEVWWTSRPADAAAAAAEMQAFGDSAHAMLGEAAWNAERLATTRAMLTRVSPRQADARLWSSVDVLHAVPPEQRVVSLVTSDIPERPDGAWVVPHPLAYLSAASFLASQPRTFWMALAVHGDPAEGFCGELLQRLGITTASPAGVAAIVQAGARDTLVSAPGRLDLPFGTVTPGSETLPAHVEIDTSASARVVINDAHVSEVAEGMALALFDPWTADARGVTVGDCRAPVLPALTNRRLHAAHLIEAPDTRRRPPIPVLSTTAIDVPLGETGNAWFGTGWHAAEAPGPGAVRWTGAPSASLTILVSHRQAVEVRMTARLASPGSGARPARADVERHPDRSARALRPKAKPPG